MARKKKYIVIASSALALVIIMSAARLVVSKRAAGRRQNATVVDVERPRLSDVASTLQCTGDITAVQQATIVARIGGTLEQVYVDMGSYVRPGQLMAVIDSSEVFQQAQQAAASYLTARADFERSRQMYAQQLISQQQFENAEAQFKVAQASHELAQARLGYARVTAPFGGYVTKRFLDPGAQLSANSTSLFILMDLSRVKVTVDILERDVPLVKVGGKAAVRADAMPDKELEGSVARLSQAIDPATRTMKAEISVPNTGGLLKPGMYATVTLVLKVRPGAVSVPSQAVLKDDDGQYVFVLEDKSARRVPVTTGQDQDSLMEITSGLKGSELVITTGQQYVKDGGPVKLFKEGPPDKGEKR